MIKVGVLGARGRMGRTVCETVEGAPDTELGAQVDQGTPSTHCSAATSWWTSPTSPR